MKRAFVDSSVLFAAVYSASGNARDLVLMAAREEVILVISELVEEETRRNLANSTPDAVAFLVMLEQAIPFEYVNATRQEVMEAAQHVALRDAPIVAAARKAKVDFLVTYDQKHLLGKPDLARFVGAKILTRGKRSLLLPDQSRTQVQEIPQHYVTFIRYQGEVGISSNRSVKPCAAGCSGVAPPVGWP